MFTIAAPIVAAQGAFKLALVVQEVELIAGLGLEDVEKRKRRAMSEGGREGRKEERQSS